MAGYYDDSKHERYSLNETRTVSNYTCCAYHTSREGRPGNGKGYKKKYEPKINPETRARYAGNDVKEIVNSYSQTGCKSINYNVLNIASDAHLHVSTLYRVMDDDPSTSIETVIAAILALPADNETKKEMIEKAYKEKIEPIKNLIFEALKSGKSDIIKIEKEIEKRYEVKFFKL